MPKLNQRELGSLVQTTFGQDQDILKFLEGINKKYEDKGVKGFVTEVDQTQKTAGGSRKKIANKLIKSGWIPTPKIKK